MRILILYPGLVEERRQVLAPHRLRLRLSRTSLVLADSVLDPEDAQVFGDVLQLPAPEHAQEAWDVLARYLARHPVDGIVAQSEASLLLGARVAREFGLPGPSVEAVMATVNKFSTRTLLAQQGIAQPAFALVRDAAGVRDFAARHGWPLVLKATASSRQRLVTLVRAAEDLEQAVARMLAALPGARDVQRMRAFAKLDGIPLGMDPREQFLVESFQEGLPLECDAMLSGTTPHWFGVCEQLPSREQSFFIDGYLLPARLDAAATRQVLHTAASGLRALGLSNTGTSVEMRLAKDAPRIIEINGRLPWDEGMQELVQAATGAVPCVLALRVAMGRKLGKLRQRRYAALLYRSNYKAGVLEQLPNPLEWKRLTKRAHAAWLFARENDQLLRADHPDSRPHVAGILTTDRHSADGSLDKARAMLDGLQLKIRSSALPPHAPLWNGMGNPGPRDVSRLGWAELEDVASGTP